MADEFFSQRYKTQRLNRDVGKDLDALSTGVQPNSDEKDDPFKLETPIDSNPFKAQIDDEAMGGYSIHDLLNGYVKDEEALLSIDECLIQISTEWDLSAILSKDITDCERFVTQKCNAALSCIVSSIIDPPTVLYDMLLRLVRKMKAISLVSGNQKMIYVPQNIEELEDIGSRLTGLNNIISVRTNRNTGHKSVGMAVEDADDESKSDHLPVPSHIGGGSGTKDDLESLIFANREYYKESAICRQREEKYKKKGSKLFNKTVPNPKSETEMVINLKGQIENNEEIASLRDVNSSSITNRMKKAHPNNVCCEGCGNAIKFSDDYDRIIVYTVPIKRGQLFYFHDTFCVTLRRLKESIRRYVMDRSLPEARRAETTMGYIRNLLMNFNTLITTRGVLPRPTPLKSLSKGANNKDEQRTVMRFVRASAYKLILRQQALEGKEAKNFEDEYSWKFKNIPISIQYTDMVVYGPCLAEYAIQQLLSKQLESLWLTLAFIVSGMTATTSLQIIEEHRAHLAKVKEIQYLDVMLTSMIEAADYTVAMALYLSSYVMENAERDLSRSADFEQVAAKYIGIASKLVGSVESDHLLSLLLETPTDIAHLSVFEIAIKYGIDDFMDDSRIQMLMAHMWSEFDFLDPAKNFRTQDIELSELITLLATQPARFYYCPVGRYWTWSVMYLVYICIVSTVVYQANYELSSDLIGAEYVMWVFNVGFVVGELTQMAFEGVHYLTEVGNYFDLLIILNWAVLALMRFGCKTVFSDRAQCYASNDHDTTEDGITRNQTSVLIYMAVFCAQICILWSRVCLIFATSRAVGPFISMIPGMIRDILKWTFVLGIFYIGYSFGVHFIVAGDISESCQAEGAMDTFSVVAEYNFILLMGQSEWSILEANECMDGARSLLLKLYMFGFSVLGTVLLLNLLIAMMASTYEQIREGTAKQVNFSRAEQTFTLSHRDAIIPPPLNVVVFAFSVVWFLIECLVWLCSGGHYILNIENLVPVRVDYDADFDQFTNKNARRQPKSKSRCCNCSVVQRLKNPKAFSKKLTTNHAETARYCQYCRCYMRMNGNISHYFKLFVNYRLDEADVKFMKSLMQNAGICPQCYRPYRIYCVSESGVTSNRLYRWQVILELLSFYVFILVIYAPLTILIALPALFGALVNRFDDMKSATKLVAGERSIVKDDKYIQLVENIIEKEGTTDSEVLSTQVAQLNRKLIQIKMNQQSTANVLAQQSMHLEDHSLILKGIVPYIKGIDVKMDESMTGMKQQRGILSTHTDHNKQLISTSQQHREEMEIFKRQLDELKQLRAEDDKIKKEQAARQQILEQQHAEELKVFSKELKQQRVLREMEAAKQARQTAEQREELKKLHAEQLDTLQKQVERQEFLRAIEERKIKQEEEKRGLLAMKQQQDMAILTAQMEQLRILKDAEDKKRDIELKLRRQQQKKMKDVEREIVRIKQDKKRQKNARNSLAVQQSKRVENLQNNLLKMKEEQERQEMADKQQREVEEIKNIQRRTHVQELQEQMTRLIREQQTAQDDEALAKRQTEKERIKYRIQMEKMKHSMTKLLIPQQEEQEEEKEEAVSDEEDDEDDEEDRAP